MSRQTYDSLIPVQLAQGSVRIVGGILKEVQAAYLKGERRFFLHIPAVLVKQSVAIALMNLFSQKTILLTKDLSTLASWDREDVPMKRSLVELANILSNSGTGHPVSSHPYSCAPILHIPLITVSSAPVSHEQLDAEAERLSRHLVKYNYRCILLDECGELSPLWIKVLHQLQSKLDITIFELTSAKRAPASSRLPETLGRAIIYTFPLQACVRDGYLLPFYPFVDTSPCDNKAQSDVRTSVQAAKTLALDCFLQETDQLRLLVTTAFTQSKGSKSDTVEGFPNSFEVFQEFVVESGLASIHPLLVSGTSWYCHDDLVIPFLSEAQKIISRNSWDVQLSHSTREDYSEIFGFGEDWNVLSYEIISREIFRRGVSRCILLSSDTVETGWEYCNPTSIIILDSSGTLPNVIDVMHPFDQKIEPEKRIVNVWFVISDNASAQVTTSKSADSKHMLHQLCAPADDGVLEYGFASQSSIHLEDDSLPSQHNIEFRRASRHDEEKTREACWKAWKVGEPYTNRDMASLAVVFSDPVPPYLHCESLQRQSIHAEIERWKERASSQMFQYTIWGVVAVGSIATVFLLLSLSMAMKIGVGISLVYLSSVVANILKLRTAKPRRVTISQEHYLTLVAGAIADACERIMHVPAESLRNAIHITRRPVHGFRITIHTTDKEIESIVLGSLRECLDASGDNSPSLTLLHFVLQKSTIRRLAHLASLESLLRPESFLTVPEFFASDAKRSIIFQQCFEAALGKCFLVETHDAMQSDLIPAIRVSTSSVGIWI